MSKLVKYIFVIIILSFLVYANSLNNAFVSDDLPSIANNPNISNIFAAPTLLNMTYHLNYQVSKLNPFGYHLVNSIIHTINSVLVFFLLLLFFKPYPSFFGSLIFAVHPVHTEAVTWIAGRNYLLMSLFILISILLYAYATKGERLKKSAFGFSLFAYFSAVCFSPFAYSLPAFLAAYDLYREKWRENFKLWLWFIPIGLLKFAFAFGILGGRIAMVAADTGGSGRSNPFFNFAFSTFTHLGLVLWPKNLTLYHEPVSATVGTITLELILLAVLLILSPLLLKKAKEILLAFVLFILFLLPTYSPVMISWVIAERYVYFSSLAFSILAAFLAQKFYVRTKKIKGKFITEEKASLTLNLILILLVAGYSIRTIYRNADWRSHASIWRATAKVSPLSPRSHNNMGDVYSLEGNPDMAALEFARAIELKPDYADAYHNLASTYAKMGRIKEAVECYQKAIFYNPRLYQSYQNLAVIYYNLGRFPEAKAYLAKALELNPSDQSLRSFLGQIL